SRMVFRFRDGSVQEETAVFTQRGSLRLLSDHLVQRGPSFPKPVEVSIDAGTGQVTVRYRDDEGREKVLDERLDLPADVSNGLILTVLKNLRPDDPSATVSMVIATPKPRLVKMVITRVGEDPVSNGRTTGRAARYVV